MVHTSEKGRDAPAESNASSTLDADAFTGQSSQAPENKSAADTSILLGPAERHRLLVEWNNTQRDYPSDRCLHHLFEDQAARTPDAVALVCGAEQLTYQDLNERANRLAWHLGHLGLAPGFRTGLLLDRSVDFVVAVLGTLKAGGVYVPLATEFPVSRLEYMIKDSGVAVLLTSQEPPDRLVGLVQIILNLRKEEDHVAQCPLKHKAIHQAAGDVAYVMYTSGSTGYPKGVAVPHRAVARLVRGQQYADFTSKQRFLLLAPTTFDASTFELWGPLSNGATCVVSAPGPLDFDQLEQLIRKERITCLWLTAGLFNQIIEQRPSMLATVGHVLTGGESLSVPHVRRCLEILPELRLTNGYGPTEGTTFSTTYTIDRESCYDNGTVPIGRPLANTRCYILSDDGQPVPVGVAGELYIGGDGLAQGYVNDAEATALKFLPDPFSRETGARIYRTGDFARYRPDGNIEFLGRRDRQVKIRGYRIELGEIESVLAGAPDVAQAVVLLREDVPGDKRLVAYIVPQSGRTCGGVILRQYLRAKLPEYMVPATFVVLDHLPLTTNGKVDRMQLPKPGTGDRESAHDADPPFTSTEKLLTAIWGELLGLEEVGVTADFFALGGHSLLTIKLLDRIQKECGVLLPLPTVLACPQIRSIAEAVDRQRTRTALSRVADDGIPATVPPLFVPGWYLNNSDFLPEGQAMYVLPFPELGHDAATCRVECIAEECLETLRALRPRGPYLLAGYSLAGLVAYEMAWRLRQQGEDVPLVALIDSCPSSWPTRLGVRVVEAVGGRLGISFPRQLLMARLWVHLNELAAMCWHLGVRTQLRALWKQMVNLNKRLKAGAKARTESPIRRQQQSTANGANESRPNGVGLFWPHVWATARFQPKRYDGKVSLMLSQTTAAVAGSRDAGWEPWAKDIESVIIPGDHQSCIREHRAILAAELAARCKAALGSPGSAH